MSSNINTNTIDTKYPIAGQDNDTQGFRDNFASIKNNLTSAKTEITDLQSKVLVNLQPGHILVSILRIFNYLRRVTFLSIKKIII